MGKIIPSLYYSMMQRGEIGILQLLEITSFLYKHLHKEQILEQHFEHHDYGLELKALHIYRRFWIFITKRQQIQ